jgi:uncharacterized membrane protein
MKDFETFKKDRLKLDPTAQKLTARQWKQAYAAHRKSLKRVGRQGDEAAESGGSSRAAARRRSKPRDREQTETPSNWPGRQASRARSDYRESRLVVNVLFWVALGLIALNVLVKALYFTAAAALFAAILTAALQVVGAIFLKMLFHLAADIVDLS